MKKALLLAAPAMAGGVDWSLGGNMDIQAGFMDQDVDGNTNKDNDADRGYDFVTDTEIHFNFRGEADNGLKYGAQVQLEVDQNGTNNSDEVSGPGWRVTGAVSSWATRTARKIR
jgi:hypothetical protein